VTIAISALVTILSLALLLWLGLLLRARRTTGTLTVTGPMNAKPGDTVIITGTALTDGKGSQYKVIKTIDDTKVQVRRPLLDPFRRRSP